MAELLSINNISLLLVFVVPGFVALSIRSQFMVGTSVPDNREQFLGASEIIAYPPGIAGGAVHIWGITPGNAGVSPAPGAADKIGREARQVSWIHPSAEPVTCQN